jgi:pimeloyl-ACP methyl ester carboxylesterase
MPISVVFVHGTWASGSTWPLLEAEIRRAFGTEQVALQYLNWSGRNTVSARLSAAKQLARLLETDSKYQPTTRRFIVAHSHGGTVALLGTRDAALRMTIAGVICLSTPFVLVRPRRFSEVGSSIATLGFVLSLALVTIGAALITRSFIPLLLGPALGWTAKVALKRGASHVRSFIDRVSLPNATGLPLLIVRAPDDEASLSLGLMQGANRLLWLAWRLIGLHWVTLIWNAVLRVADRVRARTILERGAKLWIIILFSSVVVKILLGRDLALQAPSYLFFVLFAPVFVMILTILVAALLIIPVGLINALALLPFGPEFSLFSPLIEASAESTPPGACTVVQLSWESEPAIVETPARYSFGGRGWIELAFVGTLDLWDRITMSAIRLQHSKTYSDPRAIATVVKWMQDRSQIRGSEALVDGPSHTRAP